MILNMEIQKALASMILSHSGWRGIFAASGNEEDKSGEISEAHRIICLGAAKAFAEYLCLMQGNEKPIALVGIDSRPTGKAIAAAVIAALEECGCRVRYSGIIAAPEIIAWAASPVYTEKRCGFMYISASHNPIGHNGFKFGLAGSGILGAEESAKLAEIFRAVMNRLHAFSAITLNHNLPDTGENKKEALRAYSSFSSAVVFDHASGNAGTVEAALREGITHNPIGLCCDFNGSARSVSIDRDFFAALGIGFESINGIPGEIAHRIVPEGESLEPCRLLLEELHKGNPAFVLGYVPDCDGDRGNLVIWDETLKQARALEAQETFALACVAELSFLVWAQSFSANASISSMNPPKTAVVVNDPTSLRIDRIAHAFGASVFRAEVGEANVVCLAQKLREEGYTVRILGEGSNGGNITHPSKVRDPLHTVLSLVKLLSIRSRGMRPGLFELWCKVSGQRHLCQGNFSIANIIASLPPFVTTGAYTPEAAIAIADGSHMELKRRYQKIFLREWEQRKKALMANYGIYNWEASAYNGIIERRGVEDFGAAGNGGLKICFNTIKSQAIASIWMRGSGTERVYRIMADAEGADKEFERYLINWQHSMAIEADRSEYGT